MKKYKNNINFQKTIVTGVFVLFNLISWHSYGQHLKSYQLFSKNGKKTNFNKMEKEAKKADIILFGEFHDNPIAHWLQLKLSTVLLDSNMVFGAEMFEADNQLALDSFLKGLYSVKGFDSAARLWPNYKTDYEPLVSLAKNNQLPFIATNIPRRYASKVYRGDFEALDTLSDLEKSWIAPLPILFDSSLSQYQNMLTMMGGHGGMTLVKAQAIKDATMAYFITKNMKNGQKFIHFNGAYHSDFHQGIYWYLKQFNSELKILTISTISQKDVKKLSISDRNRADFIIVVDEEMTSTY